MDFTDGSAINSVAKCTWLIYNINKLEDWSSNAIRKSQSEMSKDQRGKRMIKKNRIELPKERLEQFCRNYHIRKLSLFGSVLRDDFKASSDIDLLVEFETGFKVGLLKMARIENELSEILGRKVDLRTPGDLSRYFRGEVLENAEVAYAQG
jgi:predicted nucleotidyltransferase